MIDQLHTIKNEALEWICSYLRDTRKCFVFKDGKFIKYMIGQTKVEIPKSPGVYAIYSRVHFPISDPIPVYVGEAGNLKRRIDYHFSESATAKREGTLKKTLKRLGFDMKEPTRDLVYLKYIEVPFGRKEIETLLHEEYNINTKKK